MHFGMLIGTTIPYLSCVSFGLAYQFIVDDKGQCNLFCNLLKLECCPYQESLECLSMPGRNVRSTGWVTPLLFYLQVLRDLLWLAYWKLVWNSLKILAQATASGQFEILSGASSLHWFSASLGLAGFYLEQFEVIK